MFLIQHAPMGVNEQEEYLSALIPVLLLQFCSKMTQKRDWSKNPTRCSVFLVLYELPRFFGTVLIRHDRISDGAGFDVIADWCKSRLPGVFILQSINYATNDSSGDNSDVSAPFPALLLRFCSKTTQKRDRPKRTQRAAPFFLVLYALPCFLVPYRYNTKGFLMGQDLMPLLIDANPALLACLHFSQLTMQPMTAVVAAATGVSSAAAMVDGGGRRQQQHPWKQRWS